jgi:Matrixin
MRTEKVLAAVVAGGIGLAAIYAYSATPMSTRKAQMQTRDFAERSRLKSVDSGYAEFVRKIYREPFEGGVYIVNGDTPIVDDEELREFYRKELVTEWKSAAFGIDLDIFAPALAIDAKEGRRISWDNVTKKELTYCVDRAFGARYPKVVDAMRSAASAWEAAGDVRFLHVESLDGQCDQNTSGVVFDVRPVDVRGRYYARAFFPRHPRAQRNVLIDESSFNLNPQGKLQLVGILRHELGHVLSFRHEHTRTEAGKCFEDQDWIPVTDYDVFSVMHYPQCNGLGDWTLSLTAKDKIGIACLYGPAAGFSFDSSQCRI